MEQGLRLDRFNSIFIILYFLGFCFQQPRFLLLLHISTIVSDPHFLKHHFEPHENFLNMWNHLFLNPLLCFCMWRTQSLSLCFLTYNDALVFLANLCVRLIKKAWKVNLYRSIGGRFLKSVWSEWCGCRMCVKFV